MLEAAKRAQLQEKHRSRPRGTQKNYGPKRKAWKVGVTNGSVV